MKNSIVIIGILVLLFIAGCNSKDESNQVKFIYMRSKSTGLCYSMTNIGSISTDDNIILVNSGYYDSRSMVCVPCDSLKNVSVKELP